MEPTQAQLTDEKIKELRALFSDVRAVIFDMDGLMIDSEPFHQKAFDHVFRQYGKELSKHDNNSLYVGISDKDAAVDMVARYALPIKPEELVTKKQTAYLEFLKDVTAQPGLVELLSLLDDLAIKTAIASSSMRTEIFAVTDALDVTFFFDIFCSAEEVEHGKPAPDIFLYAAAKLGLPASICLVLEDAPSGVAAAKAAQMRCIAVPSRETVDKDFSDATLQLPSLVEVRKCFPPAF